MRTLKGEKKSGGRLDEVGDAAELLQRDQRQRVHAEHRRYEDLRREERVDLVAAGLCEVVHGCPLYPSGPPKSNATATRPAVAICRSSHSLQVTYDLRLSPRTVTMHETIWDNRLRDEAK